MHSRILAATLLVLAACGGGGGGTGAPPCQPTTCAAAGRTCGSMPDGCGETLACGGCGPDLVCGSAGTCHGKVGSACENDLDCAATDFCWSGFCSRTCGPGGLVADSNCDAATVADPEGPLGGAYACFHPVPGGVGMCWPNGSGAPCGSGQACPRDGETCAAGRCEYGAGGIPRSSLLCHRDGECEAGEACTFIGNVDETNLRSDGACLWAGSRAASGAGCLTHADCASLTCAQGTCVELCLSDGDCGASEKCQLSPVQLPLDEYAREWAATCRAWAGSGAACSAGSPCAPSEACVYLHAFGIGDASVELGSACTARNVAGAASGAACTTSADCQYGGCMWNALTGLGYCSGACVGGQSDCAGGTSCRPVTLDWLDPATTADDLVGGLCVQTAVGSPCFFDAACTRCATDAQCLPSQGVTCQSGVCRDPFGRCSTPCRTDCTPGGAGNGGCPGGTTCTALAASGGGTANACLAPDGRCVPSDLPSTLRYAHQTCGDEGEADLCYYHGWIEGSGHAFLCGQECVAGDACPDVPTATGALPTTCRPVYQFGFEPEGGGTTVAGAPLSPPDQCAPAGAFTPANPAPGAPPTVPANVAAVAASATRIDVTWSASTDDVAVAGYRVYRDGVLRGEVGPVTSFPDSVAEPGERHCYRVSAYDAIGFRSAQSAEACAQTTPLVLALVGTGVKGIALDATHVYFMEYATGSVKRVPLGGGPVETLSFASAIDLWCMGIAVHGGDVYFTNVQPGQSVATMNKVPAGGGPVTRLTPAGERHCGWTIAADATGVYWSEPDYVDPGSGAVWHVAPGGGTPVPLASGLAYPRGLAIDATSVYFAEGGAAAGAGSLKKVPKGGGAVTPLASGLDEPWAVTVDATDVYWAENGGGRIAKVPLAGGAVTPILTGVSAPWTIAVDATHVYWSEMDTRHIQRIPHGGSEATVLVSESYDAYAIALDARHVYWGSQHGVSKVLK